MTRQTTCASSQGGWACAPAGALMEDDSGELAVRNPFRELTVFDGLEESGVA